MKVISKEDLIVLIPLISDRNSYCLDDFKLLLNRFGDDYYIEAGRFVKKRLKTQKWLVLEKRLKGVTHYENSR